MERPKVASKFKFQLVSAVCFFLMAALQTPAFGESASLDSEAKKTTVFTPRGTPVEAVIYSATPSPAQADGLPDRWTTMLQSQDAQIVSAATITYNSHGYAWSMSEGGQGSVSIDDPHAYVNDGSYTKINALEAKAGDKVLYGDGVHSAVVAGSPGWVISKWGNGPLVKHRIRTLPDEFGPDLELSFYRKAGPPAPPEPPSNLRIVQIN